MADSAMTSSEATPPDSTTDEPSQRRFTLRTAVIGSVLVFVGLFLVVFLIGAAAAIIWDEAARDFFAYLRDLVTIVLSVAGIVIIVAAGVLIIQVARFVNLLRSEVKPISEDTRQAITNVRDTSAFVKKHAVEPIIQAHAFVAGLLAFLRELAQIGRMMQQRDEGGETGEDEPAQDK